MHMMQNNDATAANKLEGEVPAEIIAQLESLDKALKTNKRLYAEIKDINLANELNTLESNMAKLSRLIGQQKSIITQERYKTTGLAEKIGLDHRIIQNVQKSREQGSKSPQFGRLHALDYLHEVVTMNERQLDELWGSVQKMRQMLERLQRDDGDLMSISRNELAGHIQRFDKIFETVATQVYSLSEATEKLRDTFMEQRKNLGFGVRFDPFEKQRERQRMIDAYSSLKGVDAFPSQNAILSLSEFLPKQQAPPAQPQFGSTPFGQPMGAGLGTTSSLFGAQKPPAFSFNQPVAVQQPSSLFGPPKPTASVPLFGPAAVSTAAVTSLFGAPTTTSAPPSSLPLFGAAAPQSSASVPIQQQTMAAASSSQPNVPPFGFSNTLSSATSGTLFKGSASSQPSGSRPPLFGGLSNK